VTITRILWVAWKAFLWHVRTPVQRVFPQRLDPHVNVLRKWVRKQAADPLEAF
jgi:hypothetical protein